MTSHIREQAKLITAQLLSGAGIASGYAVGGLLAEEITGQTSMAGFAQMSVILGAGLIAYPLAVLAGRSGRRKALTLGFGIGKTFLHRLHHCTRQIFLKIVKFIIITPANGHL